MGIGSKKARLIMVGGAIAHSAAILACPDDFGQGTGYKTFAARLAELFGKQ